AVGAFNGRLAGMNPPRVLFTPHLMGQPLGPPHHSVRQKAVLYAALNLLSSATTGGSFVHFEGEKS
ncbi:MAG: hypothetical protein KC421_24945, partial [Anaerolineales bacterium]|nr:hypothetical protein [Anaerolineales bacterium]